MTSAAWDEFAELMRALKDRSGRSYAALASRLHTSASTLHRYCNGGLVPSEYALVERFARLCGATHAELLDLHRCWLRADAHRATPATPVEVQAEVGIDAAGDSEAVSPASSPSPPADGLRPPTAANGSGISASGTAIAPRRAELRRRLMTSAGIGIALMLLLGASTVGSAPAASAQPIAWAARSHAFSPCGDTYLINKDPADVPPWPLEQDEEDWARSQGAVHGHGTVVELVLEPKGDRPVVIRAVHIRLAGQRSEPLRWPTFGMYRGCPVSAVPVARYKVDLDAEQPAVRRNKKGTALAGMLPYQVTTDDALALNIEAVTDRYDVRWYLEVDWSAGELSGRTRIDDDGRPFRTSSFNGASKYFFSPPKGWQ